MEFRYPGCATGGRIECDIVICVQNVEALSAANILLYKRSPLLTLSAQMHQEISRTHDEPLPVFPERRQNHEIPTMWLTPVNVGRRSI